MHSRKYIFRHISSLVQVLVHKTTPQFSTTIWRSLGIITQPSRGSWPPGWEPVPSVMMCEAFVALSRLPQNSDEGRFFPGDVGPAPPDVISKKLPPYCTWWGSTGPACESWSSRVNQSTRPRKNLSKEVLEGQQLVYLRSSQYLVYISDQINLFFGAALVSSLPCSVFLIYLKRLVLLPAHHHYQWCSCAHDSQHSVFESRGRGCSWG